MSFGVDNGGWFEERKKMKSMLNEIGIE